MTYALQEQYTSKNQVAGSAADSVWHLGARKVSSITIHHWGLKGQQFDTVRDFLCTNDTPTSAHYVAQDGLVACIVSPDDCAFHAGNAEGNSHSIGIECRPEATDGDYATIAELIAYLRGIYGDIPLYPHNHWYNTACPGDYDLDRLDSLARGGTISTQSVTQPQEELVPNQHDKVFTAIDGNTVDLETLLNSIDRKATAALASITGLLSVQLPDPSDPGKTYSLADFVVWSATNAKIAAGAAGAAASNTDPAVLAKAVSDGAASVNAQSVADKLTVSVREGK